MTQAYPLQWPEGWPRTPAHKRKANSQFRTTFGKARQELFAELSRLGAKNVVVSSWLPLRNDGLPRADAARMRIEDPGVAVYFMRGERQLVIARDVYTSVHDNLRSIGLAIEHLRGMERRGGATMMDRAFEGFTALPPPGKPWWEVLGVSSNSEASEVRAAYHRLAKTAHPDHRLAKSAHPDLGGSVAAMQELTDAYRAWQKAGRL